MSKEYDFLDLIFKRNQGVPFNLACDVLLNNGFGNVKNATDEDIETAPVPNLIDSEFYRNILKLAREIAQNVNVYDLLKFCMINPFLRLDDFCDKLNREELEKMVISSVQKDLIGEKSSMGFPKDLKNLNDREYFEERYDCDLEAFEKLGFEIPTIIEE